MNLSIPAIVLGALLSTRGSSPFQSSTARSTRSPSTSSLGGASGDAQAIHALPACAASIRDQANPSQCLQATSVPTPGMLFPPPHDGGVNNVASGTNSFIGGGQDNLATNGIYGLGHSAVGGGRSNIASGEYSAVGGGRVNTASGYDTTLGGGSYNTASGWGSTVGGGGQNSSSGYFATVAGGGGGCSGSSSGGACYGNTASGDYSTVGGGRANAASGRGATIAGGGGGSCGVRCFRIGNQASGYYASVGGGWINTATGSFATVPGGQGNAASNYGFAAGRRAKADHTGSFVWGDSQDADKASSAADEFNVYASGGARIFSNSNASAGVLLAPGGGSWSSVSDRASKENVEPVDAEDVLERVCALPISTWNYHAQDDSIRHMGPMAQDFHAAFGLGVSDRTIDTIDPDGVALAAIQGLNERVSTMLAAKDAEIAELRTANAALATRVERLESGKAR